VYKEGLDGYNKDGFIRISMIKIRPSHLLKGGEVKERA